MKKITLAIALLAAAAFVGSTAVDAKQHKHSKTHASMTKSQGSQQQMGNMGAAPRPRRAVHTFPSK